jgi:hypothetical protein
MPVTIRLHDGERSAIVDGRSQRRAPVKKANEKQGTLL